MKREAQKKTKRDVEVAVLLASLARFHIILNHIEGKNK